MTLIVKTTGFEEYLDPSGGAWIKALIIGAHGVGKTPSAACWPKPIIADCERGLMSVASKKIPYASIGSTEDMDALLEMVRRDSMLPIESRKYLTLIIDTVDSYQRTIIQHRLRTEHRESLSGWADWGWLDGSMQRLVERLVNLKANVVVNMHYKDEKDRDGDESVLVKKARLKGDIKDAIFQDFDLIGFMETYYEAEDGERVMKRHTRWHPEPNLAMVRDRSNRLPRFTEVTFDDSDFQQIFDAITSDLDSMPESATLETLAVESDSDPDVPEANTGAGPVDKPAMPPAKRAAKKTTKKAAAKKTAAPAEEAPEKPKLSVVKPDPWAPPEDDTEPEAEKVNPVTEQLAIEVATEKLGAEVVEETPAEKPAEKPAEPEKPKRTAKACGDQPEVFIGKVTASPGCGRLLSAENTDRAKASMLTFKTYLCNDCFDAARAAKEG